MADASDSFRMSVTFFRTKWHFGMLVSDAYVKLGCWWQKWSILSTKIGFANRACFLLDQPKSFLSLKAFGRFRLFQGHFVLGACSADGRLRLWTWTCSFLKCIFSLRGNRLNDNTIIIASSAGFQLGSNITNFNFRYFRVDFSNFATFTTSNDSLDFKGFQFDLN